MMKLGLCCGERLCCALLVGILSLGGGSGVLGQASTDTDDLNKAASLLPQSGGGDDIRSAFNKNVDRVRLMVLLSPT